MSETKWIIVDEDKPTVATGWRNMGRLQLFDTKEDGEGGVVVHFGRQRQKEKTVVPVNIEIVSEAALGPTDPEENDHEDAE